MKEELFGRHGTVNAETAIYTYGEMVYRLALIQMKNRSEADDVFQEVFLRLVKYKDRIRSEEHLKAWLLRVTLNCCKKEFDKAFRRNTVAMEKECKSEESYEMAMPGNPVYEAVLALPENYKSVVHLFYDEQYSVREIGKILEVSESVVKTRLYRGREMLKEALKGEWESAGRI